MRDKVCQLPRPHNVASKQTEDMEAFSISFFNMALTSALVMEIVSS